MARKKEIKLIVRVILLCAVIGISLLAVPLSARPSEFYVSPSGTPDGNGGKGHPWDLATALSQPGVVQPGDTIWLRGGTYRGAFTSTLTGAENAPITVRQVPGERATIDGSGATASTLEVKGAWTDYWGFEVMNSDPDRRKKRPTGVRILGPHTKFINLVVHDTGVAMMFTKRAIDAEIYGCIIFNNGWQGPAPDRGHGHAIYAQNKTGTKRIVDNIAFNQFGMGPRAYGNVAHINGIHFIGNVAFNNGSASRYHLNSSVNVFVGSSRHPAEHITLVKNYTYYPLTQKANNVELSYSVKKNKDLTLKDNYFVGGIRVVAARGWKRITMTGNTLYGALDHLMVIDLLGLPQSLQASAYHFDNNTYYATGNARKNFDFARWQRATGFDQHSRWVSHRPTGVKVFVRPNQYEPGRAHIIVYNWDLKDTVEIDVTGVLKLGAKYEVWNVQDYFGDPVLTGTYDGEPLRLPMIGRKPIPPIGSDISLKPTGPEFNVFVLVAG